MVAKLALALVVVAIVISVAVIAAFWYFKETAELDHEKEMKRLERDEALFTSTDEDFDSSIDRELEREKKR